MDKTLAAGMAALKALERMDQAQAYLRFQPYPSQQRVITSEKLILAMFGGNQCLGKNTLIYDPVDGVSRPVSEIDGSHHVWAWDGQAFVVAEAGRPFIKAHEEIFKVTLQDGRWFEGSAKHLVLSPNGWRSLAECAASLPRSSSDTVPLVPREDALRSSGRAQDSRVGYRLSVRSHGAQLQSEASTCLASPPSLDGVRGHKGYRTSPVCEPMGDRARTLGCTHACLGFDLLPNQDDLGRIEVRVVDSESQDERTFWIPVSDLPRAAFLPIGASDPHPRSKSASAQLANHSQQDQDVRFLAAISCPLVTSCDQIAAIEAVGQGPIYDFEVPEFGNYWACGLIHHNSGKSHAGAHKVAFDATGRYPDWWTGPKTKRGVDIWCIGETNATTRDILQKKLFGPDPSHPGEGGLIAADYIPRKPLMRGNMPGAFDTVWVDHVSGGRSSITFKSYEQGREALASWTGDLVWVDEEPPWDCFQELVMRIIKRKGQMLLTFTPLRGYTPLVLLLLGRGSKDMEAIARLPVERDFLGWDQAKHLDEETKDSVKALFSGNPGQLQARMTGMPTISQGLVFPYDLEPMWLKEDFPLSSWWPRLGGLDVGWRHPTAAIALAVDTQSDTVYVYNEYRQAELPAAAHVANLRAWGDIDFMIDPASRQVEKATGDQLVDLYLDEWYGNRDGWETLPAQLRKFKKANNSIDMSINEITQRMLTDRIFFMPGIRELREELLGYVWREDGLKPISINDDLIAAFRYGIMGVRSGHARMMGKRLAMAPDLIAQTHKGMLSEGATDVPAWKPVQRGY